MKKKKKKEEEEKEEEEEEKKKPLYKVSIAGGGVSRYEFVSLGCPCFSPRVVGV